MLYKPYFRALNQVRLDGAAGRKRQLILVNFFKMETNLAKNVQRWQSKKDTGGKPEINAEKVNSACQSTNVKAVLQGVKQKLF